MFGFAKYDRHSGLVSRMGDVLGVDVSEEMQRGALPPEEWHRAVQRCFGCLQADNCEGWLKAHRDDATAPPSYCRNTDMLALLGKG